MTDKERVTTMLDRDWHRLNWHGDTLLDPKLHSWQPGAHPWLDTGCAFCGRPRVDHRSWIRRLLVRLLNRINRRR